MASAPQVAGGGWSEESIRAGWSARHAELDPAFPLLVAVCDYAGEGGAGTGAVGEAADGRLELFCVLAGEGRYAIEDSIIPFQAGDIVAPASRGGRGARGGAGPRGAWGAAEFRGETGRAVEIAFHPHLLAGPGAMECDLWLLRLFRCGGAGALRLEAGHGLSAEAWRWVKELAVESGGAPDLLAKARRKHALCGLLLVLAEAFPERVRVRCEGEGRRERLRRLGPLFDYLGEHMQEHVGVGAAAGLVRMSESYFTRFFRAAMGVNYSAYVEELRVNRAYELLMSESGLSLAEIAAEAGFCDQCHLSRHFRRRFGASPGRVRARERAVSAPER